MSKLIPPALSIIQFNPIALAYVVMIIGVIFAAIWARKKTREIRLLCNGFAGEFARLSNLIIGGKRDVHLRWHEVKGGGIRPDEKQSEKLEGMKARALSQESVDTYAKMLDYAEKIEDRTHLNRKERAQFNDPIDAIYKMTYTFLNGCKDPATIDTKEKAAQFDSFINEQVKHRMTLLKRISGDFSNEYSDLNEYYREEMIAWEKAEREAALARRRGPQKKN